MKILSTLIFLFGLGAPLNASSELYYEDFVDEIVSQAEELFLVHMAEDREVPLFMRNLGFFYYERSYKSFEEFPEDYGKAIYWLKRFLESGVCVSQGIADLHKILDSHRNVSSSERRIPFNSKNNIKGRPEAVNIKEVVVLLYALEILSLKKNLKTFEEKLITVPKERSGMEGEVYNMVRDYQENMDELESQMTKHEFLEAQKEARRLENLLGESLYKESICTI